MNKIAYLLKGSNCAPCKMFEPVFDKVVQDYGQLEIVKEVDNAELMQKFGIRQVPTVVLADKVNGRIEANHIMVGRDLRKETMHTAIKNFLEDTPES